MPCCLVRSRCISVDLYHWLLSVHREPKDRKQTEVGGKDYVNPMDIIPQAFFYSFYRVRLLQNFRVMRVDWLPRRWSSFLRDDVFQSRRLDWTNLDELPFDRLSLTYTVVINNMVVAMVEQR